MNTRWLALFSFLSVLAVSGYPFYQAYGKHVKDYPFYNQAYLYLEKTWLEK